MHLVFQDPKAGISATCKPRRGRVDEGNATLLEECVPLRLDNREENDVVMLIRPGEPEAGGTSDDPAVSLPAMEP